ncbi:MAG: acyltransferase family protein [Bacteroidales bacterium]|nr:acyltransferase family protein [Bacteroidales bacterium]
MVDNIIENKKLLWVDAIKGIGIILIMLVHMEAFPFNSDFVATGYVSMFFVVSGCTFNPKYSFMEGVKKKSMRLLRPYFAYTFLFVSLMYVISLMAGKDGNFLHQLYGVLYSRYSLVLSVTNPSQILLKSYIAPLWFLTAFFVSYLLVYVWNYKNRNRWIVIAYIVLAVIFSKLPILLPWSLDVAPLGALFIISGYCLKSVFTYKNRYYFLVPAIILYVVLIKINGSANMSIRRYGDCGIFSLPLFYMIGLLECWILGIVFQYFKKLSFIFAHIGRQSLRLMCIHMFFWTFVKNILLTRIDDSWHSFMALATICLLLLVNELIDRFFPKFNNLGL